MFKVTAATILHSAKKTTLSKARYVQCPVYASSIMEGAVNKEKSSTILKRLIEDSLVAFPNDAHQQLLQYLLDSGLDEAQSLKFRQAWSKVVLGTQAFGRIAKSKVDPGLFSEELIRELSFADESVVKIINATASCMKLDHHRDTLNVSGKNQNKSKIEDRRNPRDGIASLDAITELGSDLAKTLANIYKSEITTHNTDNLELFESIGLFRKSLRGTRIAWSSSMISGDGDYTPLHSCTHGYPDLVKGRLDMQLRTERNDLNAYMTTDELLGVVVSNKQAIHQERGWAAYLCLNELLSSQGLNIFPLPVGVHRDPVNLSTTFAFESAAGCVTLRQLQGPALSTYLRRIPVVAHRWCAQFAAAHSALQACSGSLARPIQLDSDVFVRENGLLLIGSVAFDSSPPVDRESYSRAFMKLACSALQSSLCLSRQEMVFLYEAATYGSSSQVRAERQDDDDEQSSAAANVDLESEKDVVFAVVVGCSLDIVVRGHTCSSIIFESSTVANKTAKENSVSANTYQNTNRPRPQDTHAAALSSKSREPSLTAAATTTLTVDVAVTEGSYAQYATLASTLPCAHATGSAPASVTLSLKALKAGVLSLHMTAVVLEDDSSSISGRTASHSDRPQARYRKKVSRIKVVVVPNYAVESVLLQDLIGHLEECYSWDNPNILLHSQLFQRPQRQEDRHQSHHGQHSPSERSPHRSASRHESPSRARHEDKVALMVNTKDVQKGWQDITRIIKNHGSMHVPPNA